MKRSKKVDRIKGITLIALVITVIVMLIIAGVAISVISTGGIPFGKMQEAANKYENESQQEKNNVEQMLEALNEYSEGTSTMCVVSYDSDGGDEYSDEHYAIGTTLVIDKQPSKANYEFLGWSDGTKTYQVGDSIEITGNITLLAQWKSGGGGAGGTTRYALEYVSNGESIYSTELYTRGAVVKLERVPNREGYVFIGWSLDPDGQNMCTEVTITKNTTVYAIWQESEEQEFLTN